jgi:ribosomal protein S18 acetylase RimI-like enzyme
METITCAPVSTNDETLFALYSAVRSDELGMQRWDPSLRDQILGTQYEGQLRGYREQYPGAEWRLILRNGLPVGWVVVDRSGRALHGIDIALIASERSHGLGSQVIRELQSQAATEKRPFVITVQRTNDRAIALYVRLGFRVTGQSESHTFMEWMSGD